MCCRKNKQGVEIEDFRDIISDSNFLEAEKALIAEDHRAGMEDW